jgi:hypothetical protein
MIRPPDMAGIKKCAKEDIRGAFLDFVWLTAYFLAAPKRLLKRSIRPPVSTTFCLPV